VKVDTLECRLDQVKVEGTTSRDPFVESHQPTSRVETPSVNTTPPSPLHPCHRGPESTESPLESLYHLYYSPFQSPYPSPLEMPSPKLYPDASSYSVGDSLSFYSSSPTQTQPPSPYEQNATLHHPLPIAWDPYFGADLRIPPRPVLGVPTSSSSSYFVGGGGGPSGSSRTQRAWGQGSWE